MKKLILCIALVLVLSGCGPSRAELDATQTSVIATSDAWKQSLWMTETAAPTRTKGPTSTPDKRSESEKRLDQCEHSGSGVRYVITGNATSVSITQQNDTGGTDQGDYRVPYCASFSGFRNGDFLYISAQNNGGGSFTCKIYDGSSVVAQATAKGEYAIATCSTSK
jgi:hypothetical protein